MVCYEGHIRDIKIERHSSTDKVKGCDLLIDKDEQLRNVLFYHENDERPVVSCAVINNMTFSKEMCSFIEYQESLNRNIGRNRKSMEIGVHVYDKIKFPLFYKYEIKESVLMEPLSIVFNEDKNNCKDFNDDENNSIDKHNDENNYIDKHNDKSNDDNSIVNKMYTIIEVDEMLKKNKIFSKYINNKNKTPFFIDSNGMVISYPPVVNSEHTKIKESTKNVFIEITGNDKCKVEDTMRCLLSNFRGDR